MTFFGSWLMVFDTSGQVRRDNDSVVLTLAGVGIARENVDTVRALIEERLGGAPVKWRDGGLRGFKAAARIIESETLRIAVSHVTGISNDAWRAFWDEGRQKASQLQKLTGQSANFAAGDSASRLLLFAIIFAHCSAHVLKQRGWKSPAPPERKDTVHFAAIFDTDIHNPEARAVLTETLRYWVAKGRFARTANLDMQISGRFQTEQEEPLILLADYIAGAFNHAHVDAVIAKPVAPLEEVREAIRKFRNALGARLQEVNQPFEEIHPLTGMWEGP